MVGWDEWVVVMDKITKGLRLRIRKTIIYGLGILLQ